MESRNFALPISDKLVAKLQQLLSLYPRDSQQTLSDLIEPVVDAWADQELAKASRLALNLLEQQSVVYNPPKNPQGNAIPNRKTLSTRESKKLLGSKTKIPIPTTKPIPTKSKAVIEAKTVATSPQPAKHKPPTTHAKTQIKRPKSTTAADAAAMANDGRTNEDRLEESIAFVSEAAKAISKKLANATVRERIELIRDYSVKKRGVGISSQTLYREEIKHLWN
jgi:hypothetical protein